MKEYGLDDLRAALSYLDYDNRDTWMRAALALKCTYGEDAFAIWDDWSALSGKYDAKTARIVWKSGKAGKLTAGTVYLQAKERGWVPDAPARETEQLRAERADRAARRAIQLAEEEAELLRYHELVADHSQQIWSRLTKIGASKYLGEKKVGAHGVRFATESMISVIRKDEVRAEIITGREEVSAFLRQANDIPREIRPFSFCHLKRGCFAVPLRDISGKLWSLQFIWPTGSKTFFYNGRTSGCFHLMGDIKPEVPLAIGEGYATLASVREATKWTAAVAFNAGNLIRVAKALREAYPEQSIIICADDDSGTAGNPGVTSATAAARAIGARLALPSFEQSKRRAA